jgi:hypothetical protein
MALTSPRRSKEQAELKRLREAYRKALKKSQKDAVAILKNELESEFYNQDLVATGDTLKSLDSELIEIDAFGFALNIGTLDVAAVYIEDGRGQGVLPVDELWRWMDAKGIDRKESFPIFKKIRDKGFYGDTQEGKHPFEKAHGRAEPEIHKLVQKNLEEIIERAANKK